MKVWMNEGFDNAIQSMKKDPLAGPAIAANPIDDILAVRRAALEQCIDVLGPETATSCKDFDALRNALETYYESGSTGHLAHVKRMHEIEKEEFERVVEHIRAIFSGKPLEAEPGKPAVFPRSRFAECIKRPYLGENMPPLPSDAEQEMANPDTMKIVQQAQRTLGTAVKPLLFDMPDTGMDHWIYFQHLRRELAVALKEMEVAIKGIAPAYMEHTRNEWLQALDTMEEEARDGYDISDHPDRWTTDKALVFRSTILHKFKEYVLQSTTDVAIEEALSSWQDKHSHLIDTCKAAFSTWMQDYGNWLFNFLPILASREDITKNAEKIRNGLEQTRDQLAAPPCEVSLPAVAQLFFDMYLSMIDQAKEKLVTYFDAGGNTGDYAKAWLPEYVKADETVSQSLKGFDRICTKAEETEISAGSFQNIRGILKFIRWMEVFDDAQKKDVLCAERKYVGPTTATAVWAPGIAMLDPGHTDAQKIDGTMVYMNETDPKQRSITISMTMRPFTMEWAGVRFINRGSRLAQHIGGVIDFGKATSAEKQDADVRAVASMILAAEALSNKRLQAKAKELMTKNGIDSKIGLNAFARDRKDELLAMLKELDSVITTEPPRSEDEVRIRFRVYEGVLLLATTIKEPAAGKEFENAMQELASTEMGRLRRDGLITGPGARNMEKKEKEQTRIVKAEEVHTAITTLLAKIKQKGEQKFSDEKEKSEFLKRHQIWCSVLSLSMTIAAPKDKDLKTTLDLMPLKHSVTHACSGRADDAIDDFLKSALDTEMQTYIRAWENCLMEPVMKTNEQKTVTKYEVFQELDTLTQKMLAQGTEAGEEGMAMAIESDLVFKCPDIIRSSKDLAAFRSRLNIFEAQRASGALKSQAMGAWIDGIKKMMANLESKLAKPSITKVRANEVVTALGGNWQPPPHLRGSQADMDFAMVERSLRSYEAAVWKKMPVSLTDRSRVRNDNTLILGAIGRGERALSHRSAAWKEYFDVQRDTYTRGGEMIDAEMIAAGVEESGAAMPDVKERHFHLDELILILQQGIERAALWIGSELRDLKETRPTIDRQKRVKEREAAVQVCVDFCNGVVADASKSDWSLTYKRSSDWVKPQVMIKQELQNMKLKRGSVLDEATLKKVRDALVREMDKAFGVLDDWLKSPAQHRPTNRWIVPLPATVFVKHVQDFCAEQVRELESNPNSVLQKLVTHLKPAALQVMQGKEEIRTVLELDEIYNAIDAELAEAGCRWPNMESGATQLQEIKSSYLDRFSLASSEYRGTLAPKAEMAALLGALHEPFALQGADADAFNEAETAHGSAMQDYRAALERFTTGLYTAIDRLPDSVNSVEAIRIVIIAQRGFMLVLDAFESHPELPLQPVLDLFDDRVSSVTTNVLSKYGHAVNENLNTVTNITTGVTTILATGAKQLQDAFGDALPEGPQPVNRDDVWEGFEQAYAGCATALHGDAIDPEEVAQDGFILDVRENFYKVCPETIRDPRDFAWAVATLDGHIASLAITHPANAPIAAAAVKHMITHTKSMASQTIGKVAGMELKHDPVALMDTLDLEMDPAKMVSRAQANKELQDALVKTRDVCIGRWKMRKGAKAVRYRKALNDLFGKIRHILANAPNKDSPLWLPRMLALTSTAFSALNNWMTNENACDKADLSEMQQLIANKMTPVIATLAKRNWQASAYMQRLFPPQEKARAAKGDTTEVEGKTAVTASLPPPPPPPPVPETALEILGIKPETAREHVGDVIAGYCAAAASDALLGATDLAPEEFTRAVENLRNAMAGAKAKAMQRLSSGGMKAEDVRAAMTNAMEETIAELALPAGVQESVAEALRESMSSLPPEVTEDWLGDLLAQDTTKARTSFNENVEMMRSVRKEAVDREHVNAVRGSETSILMHLQKQQERMEQLMHAAMHAGSETERDVALQKLKLMEKGVKVLTDMVDPDAKKPDPPLP